MRGISACVAQSPNATLILRDCYLCVKCDNCNSKHFIVNSARIHIYVNKKSSLPSQSILQESLKHFYTDVIKNAVPSIRFSYYTNAYIRRYEKYEKIYVVFSYQASFRKIYLYVL